MTDSRISALLKSIAMVVACGGMLAGCESGSQGAKTGVAVGALSGLAIGSLSGNAGKGAAAGAIIGGVGGAVIGDQNRRKSEASRSSSSSGATPPAQYTPTDHERVALAKLAGNWQATGWSHVMGSGRHEVTGTAVGIVENSYYVTVDLTLVVDEVTGETNTGTLMFASEPGRGLTMSSRFSTSPSPSRYTGHASSDGNAFTLEEMTAQADGMRRRVNIRFLTRDQWVADITDLNANNRVVSSFTFTRR